MDNIECVVGGGDYIKVLFSFNLVVDYIDDILLRVGIYCGMFCVNFFDMGYSWDFIEDLGVDLIIISDLLVGVNGLGNLDF